MDAVNPWLDPSEVRHLAEQLMRPVAPARLAAADPGFDSEFVGFTSAQVIDSSQPVPEDRYEAPAPAPTPDPTEENVTAVVPEKTEVREEPKPLTATEQIFSPTPPERPMKTRFLERVQILRGWLAKNFQASDIFILDKDGKVIFDESGHGRLHFMARNLAFASRGSSEKSGNIHVKIGPAAILEVIPCETPYGRIVLGLLVPAALPPAHIETITEVLIQTASPL